MKSNVESYTATRTHSRDAGLGYYYRGLSFVHYLSWFVSTSLALSVAPRLPPVTDRRYKTGGAKCKLHSISMTDDDRLHERGTWKSAPSKCPARPWAPSPPTDHVGATSEAQSSATSSATCPSCLMVPARQGALVLDSFCVFPRLTRAARTAAGHTPDSGQVSGVRSEVVERIESIEL
jgi:hypothetical protein